ncbi:hypothetical protein Tco_0976278 [Tanacetum coccineum]|uniref:Uncharacterized protein n=1 Tax=Tanacetum coccineum TaxID=301880 RepID=A0ABQ5EGW8_9ASTR
MAGLKYKWEVGKGETLIGGVLRGDGVSCKPWEGVVWVLAVNGYSTQWVEGLKDGLRLHSIVFFSSGSGLTADSSVLTLTLTFLDFGLDFAQSFPFHAQFCHFGSVFCLFVDALPREEHKNPTTRKEYTWTRGAAAMRLKQGASIFGKRKRKLTVACKNGQIKEHTLKLGKYEDPDHDLAKFFERDVLEDTP